MVTEHKELRCADCGKLLAEKAGKGSNGSEERADMEFRRKEAARVEKEK